MRRFFLALTCMSLVACASDRYTRDVETALVLGIPLVVPYAIGRELSDAGPTPHIQSAPKTDSKSLDLSIPGRQTLLTKAFPAGPNRILLLQRVWEAQQHTPRWTGRFIIEGRLTEYQAFALPSSYDPLGIDGDLLILGDVQSQQITYFDLIAGQMGQSSSAPYCHGTGVLSFSGRYLTCARHNGSLDTYDARSGAIMSTLEKGGHWTGRIFSPDEAGQTMSMDPDATISYSGRPPALAVFQSIHYFACFGTDHRYLVVQENTRNKEDRSPARLIDVESGKIMAEFIAPYAGGWGSFNRRYLLVSDHRFALAGSHEMIVLPAPSSGYFEPMMIHVGEKHSFIAASFDGTGDQFLVISEKDQATLFQFR